MIEIVAIQLFALTVASMMAFVSCQLSIEFYLEFEKDKKGEQRESCLSLGKLFFFAVFFWDLTILAIMILVLFTHEVIHLTGGIT